MTWIERTAYPQFKRLTSARVLHVFFTPSPEEMDWAEKRTGSPESCFALVLALKCFQKMARFPSTDEIPEVVIDHVRRWRVGFHHDRTLNVEKRRSHPVGWSRWPPGRQPVTHDCS